MARKLLTSDQLEGVYEKLKRADQSILNLNSEIDIFIKDRGLQSSIGGFDEDAFQELVKVHTGAKIPPRFSVIAGEIIHHVRSSLDHVAWLLSSEQYRRKHETLIAFPICTKEPTKKEELARYEGKVKGIASSAAKALIKDLQPYQRSDPMDDPLAIVHKFDRIDKHQTLVLVVASYRVNIQSIPQQGYTNQIMVGGVHVPGSINQQMKMDAKITTQVAFGKFGKRKNQPIIPTLTQLANAIRDVVRIFAEL